MTEVDPAVSEVLVHECVLGHPPDVFPFMPGVWITFYNAFHQVARRKKQEKKTNYLSERAIIIIREAAGLLPTRLISSPARQKENQSPSASEMFIYATGMPKDAEKPLLQVMTAEPQHITHFLSFNLPFSMGTLFEVHTLL